MCEGVCSPCENVHMRALYCVLLSVGGCQDLKTLLFQALMDAPEVFIRT